MNFMKGLNLSHDWIFGGFYGIFARGYYEICYDCQDQDFKVFGIKGVECYLSICQHLAETFCRS